MVERVGFVGLGVMGGPMAGHLLKSGKPVSVWNRSPGKADPVVQQGAQVAPDLETLGAECDIVFLCVNRTEDAQECIAQLTKKARPGTLFVDHSTISPEGA